MGLEAIKRSIRIKTVDNYNLNIKALHFYRSISEVNCIISSIPCKNKKNDCNNCNCNNNCNCKPRNPFFRNKNIQYCNQKCDQNCQNYNYNQNYNQNYNYDQNYNYNQNYNYDQNYNCDQNYYGCNGDCANCEKNKRRYY